MSLSFHAGWKVTCRRCGFREIIRLTDILRFRNPKVPLQRKCGNPGCRVPLRHGWRTNNPQETIKLLRVLISIEQRGYAPINKALKKLDFKLFSRIYDVKR